MRNVFKKILKRYVRKLYQNPPPVKENHLVFLSSPDFSDNGRAFFEYLVENGYNNKYRIIWLVDNPQKYKNVKYKNVRFIKRKHMDIERITYRAHRTVLTSRYVIFTHSIYWVRKVQEGQTYLNLWHGCGYKGQKEERDDKVIYFDYSLVTSELYRKINAFYLQSSPEKMVPIGYPRLDWFYTDKTNARMWIREEMKRRNAKKSIIWMPTYRKSTSDRLSDDTLSSQLGIPLIDTVEELHSLDIFCGSIGVLLIIKKHILQVDFEISSDALNNIIIMDNDMIDKENINLYEMISETDGLLSDYSSIATEYILLDKPIGFILDDYEEYKESRPFIFDNPLDYMPGEYIYSKDELKSYLNNVVNGVDNNARKREELKNVLLNPCNGYSKRVADYFNL